MTLREDRLQNLLDQYPPSDSASADWDDDAGLGDWALVEFQPATEEWWVTRHNSADDAGDYNVANEVPWDPYLLVNLDTGTEWEPVLQRPKWVPKRT